MIVIIDYGLGNLSSIANMFKKIGVSAMISNSVDAIANADKLVLPGVGHFKKGMDNLRDMGVMPVLSDEIVKNSKPVLGICLGAQLMTMHSEEGDVPGLGWIDAVTVRFDAERLGKLKVPHMGWSDVQLINDNPLWKELADDARFYHVHSYHFDMKNESQVIATANYGYTFATAFNKANVFGTQFHPEKSHHYGMQVLLNFSKL